MKNGKAVKKVKMKSNRAAMKRLSVTGSGLIKFSAKGKRHCLSNKSRKRKRQLLKARYMSPGDVKIVERLIPYLK